MAYNTVSIIKDVDGKPTPQYFNQLQNAYEVLQGRNGANYVEILGPNGETLSIVNNKLAVRATEIETILDNLAQKDFSTETTLAALKARIENIENMLMNGEAKITQYGSKMALSSIPETGTKTITSTVAEIFAGTTRKVGRSMMYIRNTHDSIAIRIGASDISDIKGRRILPQQEVKIEFNPQLDIPLYAVSEFGNVEVEVLEA